MNEKRMQETNADLKKLRNDLKAKETETRREAGAYSSPIPKETARVAKRAHWLKALHLELDQSEHLDDIRRLSRQPVKECVQRTQIKNLENQAFAAMAWSEVYAFIYRQTAKHKDWSGWAESLIDHLNLMKKRAEEITGECWPNNEPDQRLRIQEAILILIRGALSHFNACFMFEEKRRDVENSQGGDRHG